MIDNIIGKRYAEALSCSIEDDLRLNSALKNLEQVWRAFEVELTLAVFFSHPGVQPESKVTMVNDLCDMVQVEPEIRNLLLILVNRGKILNLKNVLEYFQVSVDQRLNRTRANISSASPLGEMQVRRLKESLGSALGKEVLIDISIDESLIGGIVLRIGSLVADASVKNRLATMKRFIEKEEVV
tara:strand:- start:5 stop:556 length:552 start_codon:yes stop_codon:yes gene_type:complete